MRKQTPSSYLALMGMKDFRTYFLAYWVSNFGDSMLRIVMGIILASATGNSSAGGLVGFFLLVPSLAGPVFGSIVDRLPRRTVLVVHAAFMAAIVLLVPLGVFSGALWLLYFVALGFGVSLALLDSAQAGVIPSLVPAELLSRANGLIRSFGEGSRLVAPALGALLYNIAGALPVALIDALTFIVVIVAVLSIKNAALRDRAETGDIDGWRAWVKEATTGFAHILSVPPLKRLLLGIMIAFSTVGFLETGIYAVALEGLKQPASIVAVFSVAQGLFAIPGGLVAPRISDRFGAERLCGIGLVLFAIGSAIFGIPILAVAFLGAGVQSVGLTWFFISFVTAIMKRSPARLQGRVMGSAGSAMSVVQVISAGLGATLGLFVSYEWLLAVIVVGCSVGGGLIIRDSTRQADHVDSVQEHPEA